MLRMFRSGWLDDGQSSVTGDGALHGTRELPFGGMSFLPPVTAWAGGELSRSGSIGAVPGVVEVTADRDVPDFKFSGCDSHQQRSTSIVHDHAGDHLPEVMTRSSLRPAVETESRTNRPCLRRAITRPTAKRSNQTNLRRQPRGSQYTPQIYFIVTKMATRKLSRVDRFRYSGLTESMRAITTVSYHVPGVRSTPQFLLS